jgi:3-methyladenine DNA glycosylase Mpg
VKVDSDLGTEGPAKLCVAIRLLTANPVVDMNCFDVECEVHTPQKVKESDRIGTPGKGDKNPLPDQLREGGKEVF